MKNPLLMISLITLLTVVIPPLSATTYKVVDEDGGVTFTDTEQQNAQATEKTEEVTLQPINAVNMKLPAVTSEKPAITSEKSENKKPVNTTYKKFVIEKPADDKTFRGVNSLTVKISIQPPLNQNHKIIILLDGNQISKPMHSTQFLLQNLFRGTHVIKAQIVSETGRILMETNNTFHIFQTIMRKQNSNDIKLTPTSSP